MLVVVGGWGVRGAGDGNVNISYAEAKNNLQFIGEKVRPAGRAYVACMLLWLYRTGRW